MASVIACLPYIYITSEHQGRESTDEICREQILLSARMPFCLQLRGAYYERIFANQIRGSNSNPSMRYQSPSKADDHTSNLDHACSPNNEHL